MELSSQELKGRLRKRYLQVFGDVHEGVSQPHADTRWREGWNAALDMVLKELNAPY